MAEFAGYPIPAFFSEVGCNVVRPRTWSEMGAIYGPQMLPTLSGAIIYEWTQEANDFGIIQYPDTTTQDGVTVPVGSPVPMQPEFNNLKSQWATCSPSSIQMSAYTPTATAIACPAVTSGWSVDPNAPLPASPTAAATKVVNSSPSNSVDGISGTI
jgi:1,3-beta-glucanosyltransferase GAS1